MSFMTQCGLEEGLAILEPYIERGIVSYISVCVWRLSWHYMIFEHGGV